MASYMQNRKSTQDARISASFNSLNQIINKHRAIIKLDAQLRSQNKATDSRQCVKRTFRNDTLT